MQNVDIYQAQQSFPALIDKTIKGDEVIITKNGKPVVKLVAIPKAQKKRKFGTAKGLIKIPDDFNESLDDFQEYM